MKKSFWSIILILVCLSEARAQSAWNQNQGQGYFKLSQSALIYDDFFNADGDVVPTRTAGIFITSLYAEYGLTNSLTGFAYVPFFFRNTLNALEQENSGITEPGDTSNSIGDTNIGISYGLLQGSPFVLNTSLTFGLPIGETSGGDTEVLQSGDGEFNQLIEVNAGYSFRNVPVYTSASVGFNNRNEGFSDEFHASFEAGVTFIHSVTAALKLDNLTSFENGDTVSRQSGLFSNNLEFFAIGGEVNYAFIDNWGLSASVRSSLSGQNISTGPSFAVGIFYDL